MAYPYYKDLCALTRNMNRGNFGLWYNKFIPVKDFDSCKASDDKGNDKNIVPFYHRQYNNFRKNTVVRDLLDKKHCDLAAFCDALSARYQKVVFKAKLHSPLITGIGESHPHEVSLLFEHNMGIPYIPASSVKGIVRFAHTLGLLGDIPEGEIKTDTDKDGNKLSFFDDEQEWTNIPNLFGTQEQRGMVVFLDAYPENVPELNVDIMNPHYGEYYNSDLDQKPPGDYLDPNPIKFLTVSKDTVFIFRALVDRRLIDLIDKTKIAFKKALTEEGVGAKTAVGYGLFKDLQEEESRSVLEFLKKEKDRKLREAAEAMAKAEAERLAPLSEDERMIEEIKRLGKGTDQISALVKKCLAGDFKPSVYEALKVKLEELDEWKPAGSKQRKAKMRVRNAKIEAKINR